MARVMLLADGRCLVAPTVYTEAVVKELYCHDPLD